MIPPGTIKPQENNCFNQSGGKINKQKNYISNKKVKKYIGGGYSMERHPKTTL